MAYEERWTLTDRAQQNHRWSFCRLGGVDQVVLRDGLDIAHLSELDLKLWMALCMPTRGICIDPRTADLLDTDQDGSIRPPEVLDAIHWCSSIFSDLDVLFLRTDSVALSKIHDPVLSKGAQRILDNLGKPDAGQITLEDVSSQERIFANTRLNGDGIIPPSSANTPEVAKAIEDILKVCAGEKDRSGKIGITMSTLDEFLRQAAVGLTWLRQPEQHPEMMPLGREQTIAAVDAFKPLVAKIDDYFTKCRLAAFDQRSTAVLNRDASVYQPYAEAEMSASAVETKSLPIAYIGPELKLPLISGMNPAWTTAIRKFQEKTVTPLLGGDVTELTLEQWDKIKSSLSACVAWQGARPPEAVMALGDDRLEEIAKPDLVEPIRALLQKDAELKDENAQIDKLEKMIRYHRDLFLVISNFVNFSEFYGSDPAIFQSGTLYLDGRACHLCIDVSDAARHAQLAGLSAAFLVYCELHRANSEKRNIVAVVTGGDSVNLGVGRNGVFYDRTGKDWCATVTRMVPNPISIWEAFWLPYRKLVRMIEEQVARRAQAAEASSLAKMGNVATAVGGAGGASAPSVTPNIPPKIELGTIALIGTVIGGMSALVAGFLQALFGLGYWLPLGLLGVMLLISGPSMLLAAIKLKQRNLGPILDANGWAVNVRARMNPAFGASLTELAKLPPGSGRTLMDPYPSKLRPWKILFFVSIAVLALVYLGYRLHRAYLHSKGTIEPQSVIILTNVAAQAESPQAE